MGSYHVSVLKQVFLYEYPNTICEDKSCKNPNTGYNLPTDIVNHELKIAVEIQSAYHDINNVMLRDVIKKDFWVNKGYLFYSVDIREYTVLEMIQLFFPKYKEIPSYIDFSYGRMTDFITIQNLLDNGKTIKEIVDITGCNKSCMQGLMNRKIIHLPHEYKERVCHIKKIVQLDKNLVLINTFDSFSDLDRHGYANGTIRRVLNGKQKYSYGYIWMYEEDYKNIS